MRAPRVWLALCALALAVQAAHAWRRWSRPADDAYGRYLARFAAAKARLDPGRHEGATVGYLGDAVRAPGLPDDAATGLLFARSALLPHRLLEREGTPFVLVNWHGTPGDAPSPGPQYEPWGDDREGVRLWRKKP